MYLGQVLARSLRVRMHLQYVRTEVRQWERWHRSVRLVNKIIRFNSCATDKALAHYERILGLAMRLIDESYWSIQVDRVESALHCTTHAVLVKEACCYYTKRVSCTKI